MSLADRTDIATARAVSGDMAAPLLAIAAITAWRVVMLGFNQLDLFMDESQYWLWGQEPAFGTFSKPPLVGWVIRIATELGGQDTAFWIRLPSPILMGITAVIMSFVGREFWPGKVGVWAGPVVATLPGTAVVGLFISTDAVLLPFFALGILAMTKLSKAPSVPWAIVLGVATGGGMMAKYAMIYFIAMAALAALLVPAHRVAWRDLGIAAMIAIVIFTPNVIWNLQNGLITLTHTADNAGWSGIAWNFGGVAEFLAAQFIALGPILSVAYILAVLRCGKGNEPANTRRFLILYSLPVFAAVTLQALIRDANANWAAPAFLAAATLAFPWLWTRARNWAIAALILNTSLAVALPLAPVFPDALRVNDRSVLFRAMGIRDHSNAIVAEAERLGVPTVIAMDRRILADLTLRTKGTDLSVYAWPPDAAPDNHYQLTRPAPRTVSTALVVSAWNLPAPCAEHAEEVAVLTAESGAYARDTFTIWRLDDVCW